MESVFYSHQPLCMVVIILVGLLYLLTCCITGNLEKTRHDRIQNMTDDVPNGSGHIGTVYAVVFNNVSLIPY